MSNISQGLIVLKYFHDIKDCSLLEGLEKPKLQNCLVFLFVSLFFFLTSDSVCLEVIQWLEVIPIFNFSFSFPLNQSIPLCLGMWWFLLIPDLLTVSVVMSPFLFLMMLIAACL